MAETMNQMFGHLFAKMVKRSDKGLYAVTTPENVYQPAVTVNRRYYQYMMGQVLLPGSGIEGLEHLVELHKLARQGKSCLVLSAHYTNYDVGALYALMQREGPIARQIFDDMVFIAGCKLTEGSLEVKALSETFSRLVISAKSEHTGPEEEKLAMAINRASQKALQKLKHEQKIFYLYPAGTRVRAGKEDTYRGLREIYNYMKKFEYLVFCGITGIILPARDDVGMLDEYPTKDKLTYRFGPVQLTSEFLSSIESRLPAEADNKQAVIDQVMHQVYSLGQHPSDLAK